MNNIIVTSVKKIKQPHILANVIYQNFIYLEKEPQLMHTKDEIIKLLSSNDLMCYLVYHNNKLIGYLVGEFKNVSDRFVFYVSYVYVMDSYRGHKIGTHLMDILIDYCKNNGIKFIVLTCDTFDKKIIDFYTKKYKFVKDPVLSTGDRHEVFCLFTF
jgi:ribosomal protein S18 acetylase RimI-like enzyme